MRGRQGQKGRSTRLSGQERGAIEAFLVYIEDCVREAEPVCAGLVHRARLSLSGAGSPPTPRRSLH